MAITLTANGYQINSGPIITAPGALVKGYKCGEYSNRENIQQTTSGSIRDMWEAVPNFNKKSSTSGMLIEGNTVGMDAYSHPYGGTMIRCRHSDGTWYAKQAGSVYFGQDDGEQTILWHMTAFFTGAELGNKTGDFDIFWSHAAVSLSDAGHYPWEQEWNWNWNEDGRAQQQGSHTAVYELEQ
tara:strand:+ start:1257 stop:1805 length:549 start_codon:yes stop_codon:yes gene_type:complete